MLSTQCSKHKVTHLTPEPPPKHPKHRADLSFSPLKGKPSTPSTAIEQGFIRGMNVSFFRYKFHAIILVRAPQPSPSNWIALLLFVVKLFSTVAFVHYKASRNGPFLPTYRLERVDAVQ